MEASALLSENKYRTLATFPDLVQVGMHALLTALEKYSFKGGFFALWQIIARQEMLDLIMELSINITDGDLIIGRAESEFESYEGIVSSGESLSDSVLNNIQIEIIVQILSNPMKYGIRPVDADMFRLCYFDLLSYREIAELYNLKYYTVRDRVERARKKIKHILCKTNV